MHPFVHSLRRAALLAVLVGTAGALRAQVVSYTFTGVTTTHFTFLSSFDAEFSVGDSWTAVVSWDTGSSPLFTSGTQAQYRVTDFSFSLTGNSGTWTTSSIANSATFTQNFVYNGDQTQFTTAWGPANLTNGSMFGFSPHSINLVLMDPTFNAIDSLTPAPTFLDRSDWSANVNETQLKIYLNNDGNRYVIGSIQSISVTGSAIPEPSTYALLAGAGGLGLAFWRRRKAAA